MVKTNHNFIRLSTFQIMFVQIKYLHKPSMILVSQLITSNFAPLPLSMKPKKDCYGNLQIKTENFLQYIHEGLQTSPGSQTA